jgi:hypothetical protein
MLPPLGTRLEEIQDALRRIWQPIGEQTSSYENAQLKMTAQHASLLECIDHAGIIGAMADLNGEHQSPS